MDANKAKTTGAITKVLMIIAIIGAVNWGLIGLFNFNLVDAIFGGGSAEETSSASRIVYAIVGIAGLIALVLLPRLRDRDVMVTPGGRYAERAV